jgi:hypothetical protein
MNKRFILFCFVLFCFTLKHTAQNLVPNPSFEQHTDCIYNSITNSIPWNTICNGSAGGNTFLHPCKSDTYTQAPYQFYDACLQSFQSPRTGLAYIELGSFVMGSSQESNIPFVKLIDTLTTGKVYCITYYVSMWNNARYSIDKLGALLTPTAFPQRLPITCNSSNTIAIAGLYSPQVVTTSGVVFEDTLNWMEVSGSFTAVGNEAYLAIGDFFTHAQHFIKDSYPANCNGLAEYYVDDVSVEEVEIAKAKNDTLIYATDSVVIGKNASEAALFSWQPTTGLSCTNCPNPKASPNVTTTYTVTKTQCKSVTTDEITVTVSPVGINEININNAFTLQPNPTNGLINISSKFEMQKIEVMNVAGQILLQESINSKTHQLQLQNFSQGIYFIKVYYPNGLSVSKKVIVTR